MQTETELNQKILNIIIQIESKFPELVKFLGEMPVKCIHSPKEIISIKDLKEYYDSLKSLFDNYSYKHKADQN
jgi:hypothetical protein